MKQQDERPEREDDKVWRLIRARVGDSKKISKMSWGELAKIARELGFEEHARAWDRSQVGAR